MILLPSWQLLVFNVCYNGTQLYLKVYNAQCFVLNSTFYLHLHKGFRSSFWKLQPTDYHETTVIVAADWWILGMHSRLKKIREPVSLKLIDYWEECIITGSKITKTEHGWDGHKGCPIAHWWRQDMVIIFGHNWLDVHDKLKLIIGILHSTPEVTKDGSSMRVRYGRRGVCCDYRKVSNISRTKFQNLSVSRPVLQLSLTNLLKPCICIKSRMKM